MTIILQQDKTTEEKETTEGKDTEAKADEETKEEGGTMDTATSEETVASAGGTDSSMVVGEEYNKMVQNIVDMGYEKAQVITRKNINYRIPKIFFNICEITDM